MQSKRAFISLAMVVMLVALLTAPTLAATILVLDTAGDTGQYTSMAFTTDGRAVISYYDASTGDLKLYICDDDICSTGNIITISSADDIGQYSSLALDSGDLPRIAYYNETDSSLEILICTATDCSTSSTVVLDSAGDVGEFAALRLDPSGFPVVAYQDMTNGDLKLARCTTVNCSSFGTVTLDSNMGGMFAGFVSMTLSSGGFPIIAYRSDPDSDGIDGVLHLYICDDDVCAGDSPTVVDNSINPLHPAEPSNTGWFTDVQVNSAGVPVIAYYSATFDQNDLVVSICESATTCATPTRVALDTIGTVGLYPSLDISSADEPIISYYDATNLQLKAAVCSDATCTAAPTLLVIDSIDDAGRFSSHVLDSDDRPWISYNELFNGDLRFYKQDTPASPTVAPLLLAPLDGAILTMDDPTFVWSDVPDATNYVITVAGPTDTEGGYGIVYTANWSDAAICDGIQCILTGALSGVDFMPGIHEWNVQAYNAGGFSPLSATFDFTANLEPTIGSIIYPTGSVDNRTPDVVFNLGEDADFFQVQFAKGGPTFFDVTFDIDDLTCGMGVCTIVDPFLIEDVTSIDGTFNLTVTPINLTFGAGTPVGSSFDNTDYGAAPATDPAVIAPNGTCIADDTPNMQFGLVGTAYEYGAWIAFLDSFGDKANEQYFDGDYCTGGFCDIPITEFVDSPTGFLNIPKPLAEGLYAVWTRAWNHSGTYGSYSAAPTYFYVDLPPYSCYTPPPSVGAASYNPVPRELIEAAEARGFMSPNGWYQVVPDMTVAPVILPVIQPILPEVAPITIDPVQVEVEGQ